METEVVSAGKDQVKTVTLSAREYKELAAYKDAFSIATGMDKRKGVAYEKYKDMEAFMNFFKERLPDDYEYIRSEYVKQRRLAHV